MKTCAVVVHSVTSSAALTIYIVIFLKLISYQQMNRRYRDYFAQAEDKFNKVRRSRSLSHSCAKTGV